MHAPRTRHDELNDLLARRAIARLPPEWRARKILTAQVLDLDWYRIRSGSQAGNASEAALEIATREVPEDAINPLFSARWYSAQCGAMGTTGDLLLHYLMVGEAAGVQPGPWFSPVFFRRFTASIGGTGRCWAPTCTAGATTRIHTRISTGPGMSGAIRTWARTGPARRWTTWSAPA